MREGRPSLLLVAPSAVDAVTVAALLVAAAGTAAAADGRLTLAVGLALVALLLDMLDGALARRSGGGTPFGHSLDTLGDVWIYLALPTLVLYRLGMRGPLSLAALGVLVACGVLRLAWFAGTGLGVRADRLVYMGLPVFWSHALLAAAPPAFAVLGSSARWPASACAVALGCLFVWRREFAKPTAYAVQAVIVGAVAAAYLWASASGVDGP